MLFVPKEADIRRFCRLSGRDPQPGWAEVMGRLAPKLCARYEFTYLRWVHFAAQWGHETNGLTLKNMRENMTFISPERVKEVYSHRLKVCIQKVASGEEKEPAFAKSATVTSLAKMCTRNPTLLADIVYGGREGTPWMQGSRYIGRGPTQITHRDNYQAVMREIARQPGVTALPNFVEVPDILENAEWGVRSAFADWHLKNLSRYADADDVAAVSAALNTGNASRVNTVNGMASRRQWLVRAKATFQDSAPEPLSEPQAAGKEDAVLRQGDAGEAVRRLQARLRELGYQLGPEDGEFGLLTARAVRAFQSEHGLLADGQVEDRTQAALDAAAPVAPERNVTAKDLRERGSETLAATSWIKRILNWIGVGAGSAVTDKAAGLGLVDATLTQAEQVKTLVDRGGSLTKAMPPAWVFGVIALGLVLLALRYLVNWIESRRVADHNEGKNLGR